MGRYIGPVCKLCRREGMKLFLKGTRCDTPKCSIERRDYPPGMHQWRRGKPSDYALQLREKQKVKRYYGVFERQFQRYFEQAEHAKGNTGNVLLSLLERRLDNIVHRLGFALSRAQSRQLVTHGHILVNNKRVDIPSYLVRAGDVIRVKNRPKSLEAVKTNLEMHQRAVPDFLQVTSSDPPEGVVVRVPEFADVSIPVQPQLIVELCSK
jgi:small subunit ribosomal protein S4